MSSIPNAKMKHAHVHHEEDAPASQPAAAPTSPAHEETLGERARELAEEAVDAVKARPKTAAAIGAAVLAGAAALIGGPAIAKAAKSQPPKKKLAAKKPAAKKKA